MFTIHVCVCVYVYAQNSFTHFYTGKEHTYLHLKWLIRAVFYTFPQIVVFVVIVVVARY